MSRTFSNKVRVRGSHKRAARNEGRPRIGQIRVRPANMPHTMFRKAWMDDGTQVAIARSSRLRKLSVASGQDTDSVLLLAERSYAISYCKCSS